MSKSLKNLVKIASGLAANSDLSKSLKFEQTKEDDVVFVSITKDSKEEYVTTITDLAVAMYIELELESLDLT